MEDSLKSKFNKSICGLQRLFSKSDIDSVYLIGSFRRGTATEMSDLDLIVVSNIYNGLSGFIRRKHFLSHFSYVSSIMLDPKCLTVNELKLFSLSEAFINESPLAIYRSNELRSGGRNEGLSSYNRQ